MKKCFLSPLFAPVFNTILWVLCFGTIFIYFSHLIPEISEDGQFIDRVTFAAYILMFLTFAACFKDFKGKRFDYCVFVFLGISAMLREAGIQHWIPSKDTTAFKIRFFTNPDNPLCEKILAVFLLGLVAAAAIYITVKYAIYLIKSFFMFDTIAWSVGTLCGFGILAKIFDRFNYNYTKYTGEYLSKIVVDNLGIFEETAEIFIPVTAIIILWQYHILKRDTAR